MEPDEQEQMPTGVPLSPERVINALQQRAAGIIQNLTMDIALRDATIEVLEERLRESEMLREEADGVIAHQTELLKGASQDQAAQPVEREWDGFLEMAAPLSGRPGLGDGGQSAESLSPTA